MKKCRICTEPVSQQELKCVLCRHLFHVYCAKILVSDAVTIKKDDNNICWFCDECSVLLQSDFLRSVLSKISKLEAVVEKIDNKMTVLTENQSKGITEEKNLATPASNTRSKVSAKKRKGNQDDIASSIPTAKKPLEAETNIVEESEMESHNRTFRNMLISGGLEQSVQEVLPNCTEQSVQGQEATASQVIVLPDSDDQPVQEVMAPIAVEENRWIFVSRLSPSTTASSLTLWLKSKLNSDDVLCFPLIPRGFQINELKVISFKMRIPKSLLIAAKSKHNWPPGVQVRDFIVRAVTIPTIDLGEEAL